MKKLITLVAILATSSSLMAQAPAAGMVYMKNKDQGKKFEFGSQKSVDAVLANTKAYNLNDGSDLSQYVEGDLKKLITKWHTGMQTLNEVPRAIFPVKIQGSKNELVFMYADENRVYKNGSKEKLVVLEITEVTPEGKITNFNQFTQIPETNEFGKTTGGKVYLDKYKDATFQFSNRGEVESMEKFIKAYNAMDVKGCADLMADKVTIHDFDGNVEILTKDMLPAMFGEFTSLDWKPMSIIATKITDTDPTAGAMVNATEKRVLKNGTVWEKDLFEYFEFDINGKIKAVTQYSRGLDKK